MSHNLLPRLQSRLPNLLRAVLITSGGILVSRQDQKDSAPTTQMPGEALVLVDPSFVMQRDGAGTQGNAAQIASRAEAIMHGTRVWP